MGPRVLEGARRGLAEGAGAALLGAQDRQRVEHAAEEAAREGQAGAAGDLEAETRARRRPRSTTSPRRTRPKYEKAADCLDKDREALLAFYDFPAEHWKHLRTTNPIESTFATVRHRTIRSKGCLSNKTALAMVFKLVEGARTALAPSRRPQPVAKNHRGCEVRRRAAGRRQAGRPSGRKPPPPDPSGRTAGRFDKLCAFAIGCRLDIQRFGPHDHPPASGRSPGGDRLRLHCRDRHRDARPQPASRPAVPGAALVRRRRRRSCSDRAGPDPRAQSRAPACRSQRIESFFTSRVSTSPSWQRPSASFAGAGLLHQDRLETHPHLYRPPRSQGPRARTARASRFPSSSSRRTGARRRSPTRSRPMRPRTCSISMQLKEKLDAMLAREGRTELAQACFDFLPTRARLDLAGWPETDIFAHE